MKKKVVLLFSFMLFSIYGTSQFCSGQPDGTPCSDGDACTEGDVCIGGVCTGAEPLDCNDEDPNTIDTCDPILGCANTPLPVELVDFAVELRFEEIALFWKTASETNNSGFEVQKSPNGRDWKIIDFVEGRGTTTEVNEYQYEDLNPFSGLNYYRLKQIDFDRAFEYSKVVAVEFDNSERGIYLFPNPSNGLINLQISNPSNQRMKIKILDNLGIRIWESELIEVESNWRKEIEIEGNGIYFITVQIGGEIYYKPLVIADDK